MATLPAGGLTPRQRAATETLVADLERVFGARLRSVVAYGQAQPSDERPLHGLALVESLTFADLQQLVPLALGWRKLALAVPLILPHHEFLRTLDVFPLEYGNIIANHVVVAGSNPFADAQVSVADRRRGCELEAKSHVIHLREGFLETGGDARQVVNLIAASAASFRSVLENIIRLERGPESWTGSADDAALATQAADVIGIPAPLVAEVLASSRGSSTIADPAALLARYIDASERIWRFVDGWTL
ncbi:MAG TPA: hypothetical protein VFJ02_12870 [Vicinamibacterales bacterium]|nr:hypothetical protein [Vicinamibacterales bacterium]